MDGIRAIRLGDILVFDWCQRHPLNLPGEKVSISPLKMGSPSQSQPYPRLCRLQILKTVLRMYPNCYPQLSLKLCTLYKYSSQKQSTLFLSLTFIVFIIFWRKCFGKHQRQQLNSSIHYSMHFFFFTQEIYCQ